MTGRRSKVRARRRSGGVTWAKARRVLAKHGTPLLRRVGVVGIDLGIKRASGELLVGPCIRIHVAKKHGKSELHPKQIFPKAIEGVPIDVVESRFRVGGSCPDSTLHHRVFATRLLGGVSVGRPADSDFGTLGAVAVDPHGFLGGLTCAHVCESGDTVVQPHEFGPTIGFVTRDSLDEVSDAAFILFGNDRGSEPSVLGIGPVANQPKDVAPEDLPLDVELVGACSGRSRGLIISTDFSGVVDYPDGPRRVQGQLCIEPTGGAVFARQGDSGAGVLLRDRFIGLLIAADQAERGGTGMATPMSRVLERLGVVLA